MAMFTLLRGEAKLDVRREREREHLKFGRAISTSLPAISTFHGYT